MVHALGVVCRELLPHAVDYSCLPLLHCIKDSLHICLIQRCRAADRNPGTRNELGPPTELHAMLVTWHLGLFSLGPPQFLLTCHSKPKLVLTGASAPVASGVLCDQASEEKWSLRQQAGGLLLQLLSSDEIGIRRNFFNPEK